MDCANQDVWHSKLCEALKDAGFHPTNADPCMFTNKKKTVFLLVYVDDILIASKRYADRKSLIKTLQSWFNVKDLGEAKYCLGIQIVKMSDSFTLCQSRYIKDLLTKFGMADCKGSKTPLPNGFKITAVDAEDHDDSVPYKELIGSLMYLALGTRPDIAHAVSSLSQYCRQHTKNHWIAAKHVLRYLKNTINLSLCYKRVDDNLSGFVDADWGNSTTDRRSFTRLAFTLAGAAINWESRKQKTVALSSTEAEYMGLTDAAKEAIYIIGFLKELGFERMTNVTIYNDNRGARELAHNPVFHNRSKHIDIRCHFIREALQNHSIRLEYMPTEEMPADILTKGLGSKKHNLCLHGLGLLNIQAEERQD